ncbi:putative mitochondrial protein AtMg00310 [Silene latifolia]|uniref:putative mitochondrial protein AtMg00310 n=1 Tax=Silene latifolia TaxID=37657 RepID=UPI003D77FCEF
MWVSQGVIKVKEKFLSLSLTRLGSDYHRGIVFFYRLFGRLALISSVLSSLSVYFLSVFKIPISVTKRLDAILSHFWWAGQKKSPSISWCSRLFLSQPKGNGGLGIRRMKEFNQALLAKIGWRMITHPDSILSRSIGAKYGLRWRDGDLIFNNGKSNSSWGWKGIVWGLQLIKPLLAWNISPSSDLSVWNTRWVNGRVPKPRCLELLTDPPNLSNLRIKNIILNYRCWDRRLVSMFFDETSVKDILAIPIRCSEGSDNFFWSASSSGDYSLRLATTLL